MTAKIKLNAASGGGSFSLQAPSSSSNARVMTLPDTADGTILTTTNPKSGNTLQILQSFKNDTFSTSSTDTLVDITGFNITITPSSSSNKILLMSSCGIGIGTSNTVVHMELFRGSTQIALSASSSQNYYGTATHYSLNREAQIRWSYNFLDTPNTTSAVTYQWKCKSRSNTAYINNRFTGDMGTTATVIAMEVAA